MGGQGAAYARAMLAKDVLRLLNLGNSVAEHDEALEGYFVETEAFRQLVRDECDIVGGDKGTGKTALYRILQKRYPTIPELNRVEVIPAVNPIGNPVFQRLAEGDVLAEGEYTSIWKAYFLALVGNWVLSVYEDGQLRRQPRRSGENRYPSLGRSICRGCGASVGPDQAWCEACRPGVKLEAGLDGLAAARAVRSELRMRGQDPAASDRAKAKLRDSQRKRRAEESAWDRANPQVVDPAVFRRDVLPLIQGVPVRRLAALTGLSVGHCALVRRGLRTPHPRWWDVLQKSHAVGPVGKQERAPRD